MSGLRWVCLMCVALVSGLLLSGPSASAARAAETADIHSVNDFGGVGLLTTRTARFAPDGQFAFGAVFVEPYRRYYMTWQILPFVEATFRYTDITNIDDAGRLFDQGEGRFFKDIINLRSGGTILDRAFDFKFKIWGEGKVRPAFAIGLQDTIGTGLFSGEYMVLTKRVADFDLSAGIGWGYLGSRSHVSNPLRAIDNGFKTRDADVGQGGQLGTGNFFSGRRVAFFGGVEYFTPIRSLSLKVEYSGADPAFEPRGNAQPESIPVNFGVNYRPHDWFDMAVGFERGNTLMVRIGLRYNLRDSGLPGIMDPPPAPVAPRDKARAPSQAPDSAPLTAPDLSRYRPGKTWADFLPEKGAEREGVTPLYRPSADYAGKFGDFAPDVPRASEGDMNPSRLARLVRHGRSLPAVPMAEPRAPTPVVVAAAKRPAFVPAPVAGTKGGLVAGTTDHAPDGAAKMQGRGAPGAAEGEALARVADAVFEVLDARGFRAEAIEFDGLTATVYFMDTRYRAFARNLGRISRILTIHLPHEIEVFTLVHVGKGLETSRVSVFRKDLENAARHRGSPEEILANAEIAAPRVSQSLPRGAIRNDAYPAFTWSLGPELRQHVGDPDVGIYAADLRASLDARLRLRRNLFVSAGVSKFIAGNLDRLRRDSNSALPRVRSDIRRFVQEGRDSIDRLQADYLFRPASDVYGRVSGGIFETMYGGVSGELLWQKPESPLALGVEINWVKKRDFDQDFGFQGFDTVTGHASLYYDLPFYDMQFATHVGRYLARDWGATFDISRRFDSGIRVGGFFTLTDASAEEFGEGSFDKGFYMTIPLDLFLLRSSPKRVNFAFRPLTRDGGQRVNIAPRLKTIVDGDRPGDIRRDWHTFMD